MPLLAFAGGFPTTLLYGLLPPAAVLALARSGRKAKARAKAAATVKAADADADAAAADADADAETASVTAVAINTASSRTDRRARGRGSGMGTAPMVEPPAGAAPSGGGEERLLSEATHWVVAAIAVGMLTTSAVCYALPARAVHLVVNGSAV